MAVQNGLQNVGVQIGLDAGVLEHREDFVAPGFALFADGEDADLLRRKPGRERAGEVFDEAADEAIEAAEGRAERYFGQPHSEEMVDIRCLTGTAAALLSGQKQNRRCPVWTAAVRRAGEGARTPS